MKYTVTFIISFLFLILFAGTTIATPIPLNFEINKFDTIVNLSNVDIDGWAGISADIAAFDLDNPAAFSLGVGETKEIDFIDIEVGGFLGGGTFDIEATLAFSSPTVAMTSGSGDGWFGTFLGAVSAGGLTWDNPVQTLSLFDGTSLTVEFENILTGGLGNSTTVQAYVTNNGGTAPVPEPATMLLFGTGLLGLAGLRLRKKK